MKTKELVSRKGEFPRVNRGFLRVFEGFSRVFDVFIGAGPSFRFEDRTVSRGGLGWLAVSG
jgi:hypothetical protein